MKLFTGWVLAASLALGATAADAQVLGPSRVSDFGAPYSEAPPYRGGPYYAPPPAEVPPPAPRYGYGNGYGGNGYDYEPAGLLPPHEVYNIIREAGFSPLGIPRQRGFVYTIAVIDRGGEDGRLVIDARNGRIIRFMPAWQISRSFDGALNSYGPPGMPPPTEIRGEPRPPASVPRVASRSVPVPKPSPLAAGAASEPAKPAAQAIAKPPVLRQPTQQQAAVAQPKPADTAPAATAGAGQTTQANPEAPAILPTQDMPKAQGLD
jgi:hypothetical protein